MKIENTVKNEECILIMLNSRKIPSPAANAIQKPNLSEGIESICSEWLCIHFSSNGSIYGGLDLESYASVKQRVSSCGSIETSKLLIEITTGSMASYADSDLIQILEVWISEGAPE